MVIDEPALHQAEGRSPVAPTDIVAIEVEIFCDGPRAKVTTNPYKDAGKTLTKAAEELKRGEVYISTIVKRKQSSHKRRERRKKGKRRIKNTMYTRQAPTSQSWAKARARAEWLAGSDRPRRLLAIFLPTCKHRGYSQHHKEALIQVHPIHTHHVQADVTAPGRSALVCDLISIMLSWLHSQARKHSRTAIIPAGNKKHKALS